MTIITRAGKGSALSHAEMDGNLLYLDSKVSGSINQIAVYDSTATVSGSNTFTQVGGTYRITGSLGVTGGITGSLFGTATQAVSASNSISSSYALTASYALNGGGGGGGVPAFPYTGSAEITGSLSVDGPVYVDTLSNYYVPYSVNGVLTDSMIYIDGGKMMIGLQEPTNATLTLAQPGAATGLEITQTGVGIGASISAAGGIGAIISSGPDIGAYILSETGNPLEVRSGTGIFQGTKLIVFNNGNVAIGTTSNLGYKLVVDGEGLFGGVRSNTGFVKAGGTSTEFLKADGSVDNTLYQPILLNPITGSGLANYLPKFTTTASLGNSLIYENTANIIIGGTTSPPIYNTGESQADRLTVYGKDNTPYIAHFYATGSQSAKVRITSDNISTIEMYAYDNAYTFIDTDFSGFGIYYIPPTSQVNKGGITGITGLLTYFVAGNDGNNARLSFDVQANTKMTILANGYVGIGTTAPTSKLHVVGLPTSSAGLTSGAIWNDGGTLKVV